ncbi:MAG TPA: energy transducer TonB [Flavobacteriales bacterium]|nr:energy transducer TonB [Flavobacteriales bacterium]HRE97290.1 energy transducer TonB [Flavobacteriales bacterium]
MTPIENISFSFPCNKDFDKMKSCDGGRFCTSCEKTIVDFRKSDISDLHRHLEEKGTVCGVFSVSQVRPRNRSLIIKGVLAGALLSYGFGVYARGKNESWLDFEELFISMKDMPMATLGMVIATPPVYKHGGQNDLDEFIRCSIRVPDDIVSGEVVVEFTIDTSGIPIDIRIVQGLSESANREAMRIISMLEFIPARKNGQKVPFKQSIPISFALNNGNSPHWRKEENE